MEKNLRKNNGITLIALVITIVILLILAGITIASLTGDNGLFSRAQQAKNKYLNAVNKENAELAKMNSYITTGRENSDKISELVNEVSFEIRKVTGTTIQIQIGVKALNSSDVRGYFVYENGEIVSVGENNLITIKNLDLKTEYIIKCGVIDKNGKIKESTEKKAITSEEEVLYEKNTFSSLISGFEQFRVDSAAQWPAFSQSNNSYIITGLDANGRAGVNTKEKIDLTNIQKIQLETGLYNNYGSSFIGTVYLGIYDKNDNTLNFAKSIKYSTNAVEENAERKTLELDVSDIRGEYYIKVISLHPSNISNYGFYVSMYSLKVK